MSHSERTVLFALYTLRERLAMLKSEKSLDVNLLQAMVLTLVQLLKLVYVYPQSLGMRLLVNCVR